MKKAVLADAVGGVVLTVFVTAVLTGLHAQVGGNHGIVNFLGSAELPIVASVLMLDSLREAIGSIYEGEHRQNIFVAGIVLFVVALLLASKGVDIEVARHRALEDAVLGATAVTQMPAAQQYAWLHSAEQALPLPVWVVPANVLVWVAAIAVSIWNRALAIGEKERSISRENVEAFVRLLDESRRGDAVVTALLEDERRARAELERDDGAPGAEERESVRRRRDAQRRHQRALDALQLCLRRDLSQRETEHHVQPAVCEPK
ncbi:hypothetical protein [Paraburkholderia phenoliruptrix]|uniref:hypothetical protein n=1 Tax=Paraburkholderia phenoliruptrix TaxID=252970 RepID=UPI001C6F1B9A|nr:hypothetical protein [Paraburkholderia phenoliruptrix]MBW9106808.1 hypothetical protein [Paraburkholderia phenoliruptrix]MBW9131803.1 hypothetical protein [Paraburkholderia ginsengiterrae]